MQKVMEILQHLSVKNDCSKQYELIKNEDKKERPDVYEMQINQ